MKMNNTIKRIKLSKKQLLIIAILFLLFLMILKNVVDSFSGNNINYKTANAETFISMAQENYDRQVYWNINDIISNFVFSYQTVENMDTSSIVEYNYNGYKLEEYYDTLDIQYKKFLGKTGFINLSKSMLSKFAIPSDKGIKIVTEKLIKKMYKINDQDMYFCELNTVNQDYKSYIGIKIDTVNNTFNIFYIE